MREDIFISAVHLADTHRESTAVSSTDRQSSGRHHRHERVVNYCALFMASSHDKQRETGLLEIIYHNLEYLNIKS